jgi:hypothetical protein
MEAEAAQHATALLLRDGVVILGVAMVFVTVFRRLGLGAVLGYLLAGRLIGSQGLGPRRRLAGDDAAASPNSASSCCCSWSGSSSSRTGCGG